MAKPNFITIDNVKYPLDSLSEKARQQISNVRIVDQEIKRLQVQLTIAQTARAIFATNVKSNLPVTAKKEVGIKQK